MKLGNFRLLLLAILHLGAFSSVIAQVADPVLSASKGTSSANVTVTANESTPGTTLYYTVNDGNPTTASSSLSPGGTIVLNLNSVLKIQAYQGSATPSAVVTAQYTSAGIVSTGSQHTIVLKGDGTMWSAGANGSGQLATGNTTPATLPLQTSVTGASPIIGITSKTSIVENGLPQAWEIANFGQTGLNPNAKAPNGSGLTILQCYQQGINPQQTAPAQPFSISIAATGPYNAPAYPVIATNVTHPSTTTISRVDFYNISNGLPGTLLGSVTQAPYQYTFTSPLGTAPNPSQSYNIKAIAFDNTGASVSATTQFVVNSPNFYQRGSGTNSVFLSTIVAIDSEKGQFLDGQQGTDANNNFSNLYFTSQYPWFLRTQAESNELWKHIVSITSGTPSYATFDVAPTIGGSAVGGAPPMVAFGSQGGGTPIYTNQTYNFGVAAGGQVVFNPITISSINTSTEVVTTAANHGLHVGQMIVISGGQGTSSTVLNGTFVVASIPALNQLKLNTPSGTAVNLSGTYTASSALITNADIKVEVYAVSSFASNARNVAPVAVQAFTVPRQSNATAWAAFVANGYLQDNLIGTVNGNTINFDTQIQFLPGTVVTQTYLQQVQYPLLITHKASSANYYYKVSYMGVTAPDDSVAGSYGTPVVSSTSDSAMGVDSAGNQTWNVGYTLDFISPSAWQAPYINTPQFQGTPLPTAYQNQSVDELIHNAPAVKDTLDAPGSTALNNLGLTKLGLNDKSPELRDHPQLDQFVASMNNDPMALANYVVNQINLTDAVGYDTNGNVTDQSINPQGVSRDALATFLEGEGSPAEQDALLIYFLRQAGYSCGYVFPQQDQTLMFDQQLSSILRMQIRGAEGPSGGLNVPELIPVNYPWVAAYLPVNGTYKWVHIFPWIKDTVVNTGNDLWGYLPTGYQTGAQWALHYVLNDPTIRQLTPTGGSITDDINTLFPLYVQNQIKNSSVTMSELGTNWYNRQNYHTSWDQFPRPWQTPTIADGNIAQNLDYTQNPSALTPALQNIFDTISIQVLSDRNGNGTADAGEPVINTGTLRLADIHDRRFLLYDQVTSAPGATAPTYNMILSLEPYSSTRTAGPYTFTDSATYNGTANADPGDLMNQQYASAALQTTSDASNDDSILFKITYNRHLQAQSIPNINALNPWNTFLGVQEKLSITDTRNLRKGDMACLCLDYGQVSAAMLEFQAEKYASYQQTVAANPSTAVNPELAQGQLLFLMGDSFYNKIATLKQSVESWTETNDISWFEHGLSKLSPYRNSDGTPNLINNAVNLRYPRVDMAYQYTALVGNGTSNLASGDTGGLAIDNAGELIVVGGSAYEHIVLNQFFQQASAISTVKLLDIAQGWTPSTQTASHAGTGPITLTSSNYTTAGTATYPGNSGNGSHTHTLEYWCGWDTSQSSTPPVGSIWYNIDQILSSANNPNLSQLSTVYVTPGPQNAVGQAGQAYTGMGAMTLGVGNYGAYISDNQVINNGGFSGDPGIPFYNVSSFSSNPGVGSSFSTSLNLSQASDGTYSVSYSGGFSSTAASYTPTPITISSNDFGTYNSGLNNSSLLLTPDGQGNLSVYVNQTTATGSPPTINPTGAVTATANQQMASSGNTGGTSFYGALNSFFGAIGSAVSDPVNSVTGEFYVNSVDVKLNGPMPLEIRRVYGSLNQASHNFGYGWRLSYFPYLMVSNDAVYNTANTQATTAPKLIYAPEMDGSVIAYRQQTSPSTRWIPQASDNPNLANASEGTAGGGVNPFNNHIDESADHTSFTLTGSDGSVRTFAVTGYPTTGSTSISRARPYLQKWIDNRGNYYTFSYGTSSAATDYGQLNAIQSSNGNFVRFTYDTYGHITKASTGDGRILYYQYDSYGDLTQVTLPDASTIQYAYQHATAPASAGTAVPGNGSYGANSALITSDNNITVTSATNASPSVISTGTITHGLQVGQIVTISGATGNTAINGTYTVGTVPSSTSFTLLTGATASAPFSTHLIVQETKPNGRILQNTYASANNYAARQVVTQSATVGATGALVQNASFNYGTPTKNGDGTYTGTTVITDVNNNTTTYKYTSSEITEVDYPAQNGAETNQASNGPKMTQSWYSTTGSGGYQRSLHTVTDRRGLLTTYTYDGSGNILTMALTGNLTGDGSNSESSTTTMTYNNTTAVNLPGGGATIPYTLASVVDQLGNGSSYVYGDSAHPYEPTTINQVSSGGTVSTTTRVYSNSSSGSGNAFGLLTKEIKAAGSSDQSECDYSYNGNGFITSKTEVTETNDPSVTTNYAYNLRGEMTSETNAASGRRTQYSYDALGHRTGSELYDENSNLVSWNYSYFNQNGDLEWQQGPRFSPSDYVTYQHDGAGRVSQQVKWLSAALNDGSSVTSNGYATTVYQHDTAGNLTEMDDPNQNASTMTYDADGEMLGRVVHNGSSSSAVLSTETMTYEPGGKMASHTAMLGSQETLAYTYNGQVKSDTTVDTSSSNTVNSTIYLYDLTGRVVKETLTSGSYWTTSYDDFNRVVTRKFFNSGGTQLMQESETFDRRGNVVSKTDVSGYTFATTYDGLNRPKTRTGPPAAGTTAQQSNVYVYDAGGQKQSVTNATGERTDTYLDAEGRPTLVSSFSADGSISSNTGYWYSPDHQSVVTTAGTGAANSANPAVTTTTYTDTEGHVVALRHADGTSQVTAYDPVGNKGAFSDEQGALTTWSYDALNRVTNQTLPGGASTNFTYTLNSPGETVTRSMPEGVSGKTNYDSDGREIGEELDGASSSATRKYTYSYSTSGTGLGLLQSVVDVGRGFTTTTSYDAWQRPSTVNSAGSSIAQQNQNTTYGYDNRGLVNSIAQSYAVGSTGPSTQVTRGFDAYGQINAETVSVGGTVASQWAQSWDGAGRRSALNSQLTSTEGPGTGNYSYQYNADGLLTQVGIDGLTFSYGYGDNDLLRQRISPLLISTVTQRDTRGRITADNVFGLNQTLLSETLQWRNDARLGNYTDSGPAVHAESRTYAYDGANRISSEPYYNPNNLSQLPSGSQTALYGFDQASVGGTNVITGLGVRTEQKANVNTGYVVTTQDNFKRSSADAYQPGNGAAGTINFGYDGAGNATSRNITGGNTQALTWDSFNRLVKVSQRSSGTSDFDWTTVYDGLGRRVQTTFQPMNNGVNNGSAASLTYYYDPQVEFLELGVLDGIRQWKVYGPDRDGTYGGQQGCGGLDGFVDETTGNFFGSISNFFGDAIGQTSASNAAVLQGAALGGYGPMPGSGLNDIGYAPLTGSGVPIINPAWRSHYLDWTQFYSMGARYYDPLSGRFLSADPAGYDGSMSLYDYCNGDPVNGYDPDGRFESGFGSGQTSSIAGNAPNSAAFSIGLYAGSLYSGGGTGLQNSVGGEVSIFTLGQVQGAFGSDPNSFEYKEGQYGAGIGVGFLGAAAAAPVALDLLGSSSVANTAAYLSYNPLGQVITAGVGVGTLTYLQTEDPQQAIEAGLFSAALQHGTNLQFGAYSTTSSVPNQLSEGVKYEDQRLADLNVPKNTTVFQPTSDQTQSAAFSVIVGQSQRTPGGQLVGTISDSTAGGELLEIKGGSSPLNSSYQLRLQVYNSVVNNKPLTLDTTRPVNPTFLNYLQRWGVKVQTPPKKP